MYWLEVSVVTDGEAAEAIADALRPFAYNNGVVLEQLGDMTDLAPDALEPTVTVKIYLPEEGDTPATRHRIEEILYHMNRLYPIGEPVFRQLQEEDWANAWKANYRPFRVGERLWIQPSWLNIDTADLQPEDLVLTLDPGMAFGTGLHPTTQMCLQAVAAFVKPGMQVLDVGTGSGILAVAAAKLGAAHILAVDTDPLAVSASRANAAKNDVADQITVQAGSLADVWQRGWDLVLVNILAPVIVKLVQEDRLLSYANESGRFVLSGIVAEQADEVETAVVAAGGRIITQLTVRDWVSYLVAPQ